VKNEVVELAITGFSHDGRGVGRIDEKVIFVHGALPQEQIKAKITHTSSKFNQGQTVEIVKPSPDRVLPHCAHFGLCGGCQWQHVSQDLQISHKQSLLAEQLAQAQVEVAQWLPPLLGPEKGYRYKARLAVKYVEKKNTVLVGFREQRSNKIAILDNCSVLHPKVGSKIIELRQCIADLSIKNEIAQIEVAIGMDEIALVFRHLVPIPLEDKNKLKAFCQQHSFSCYLQPDGVESVHCIWPNKPSNDLTYRLEDQNLEFKFHPLDFIQVNPQMNQQMINQALSLLSLSKDDVILDLFCGLGNFSLSLAKQVKHVVGIECATKMVERATNNAKRNQLNNVEFYAFDLTKDVQGQSWASFPYSVLILDPPRSGALEVVNNKDLCKAKHILYISCNPATFVRDAAILQNQQGYQLERVGVMDMFTHTAHVETMGLFTLK
jgi:23S rRNA (uracil1939-C5)-methyltransferase